MRNAGGPVHCVGPDCRDLRGRAPICSIRPDEQREWPHNAVGGGRGRVGFFPVSRLAHRADRRHHRRRRDDCRPHLRQALKARPQVAGFRRSARTHDAARSDFHSRGLSVSRPGLVGRAHAIPVRGPDPARDRFRVAAPGRPGADPAERPSGAAAERAEAGAEEALRLRSSRVGLSGPARAACRRPRPVGDDTHEHVLG